MKDSRGDQGVASLPVIRDTWNVKALAWCALFLAALPGAAAAGEGESALSGSLGAGTFVLPGEEEDETIGPTAGGVGLVSYERGFSEALSWRVELSGGLYGGGGLSWSGAAAGGLVYRFDVLKYVPYALLEVGGSVVGGGELEDSVIDPVVLIGGGLDFLLGRSRSWGLEARLASFAGDTTLISLGARYTIRWGYF
jgi:hypothetical protein